MRLRPELTSALATRDGESEIRRDPKDGTWRGGEEMDGEEWDGRERFPCWELGFEGIGGWDDDEVDAWGCEGKMDMKDLEGKGKFRRCKQPQLLYQQLNSSESSIYCPSHTRGICRILTEYFLKITIQPLDPPGNKIYKIQ